MLLLIDNYDSFTWNLVQRFGEIDPALPVEVVRNDKISARGAAALRPTHVVISPGPCTPREAGVSGEIIRVLGGVVPILGVCLGHQCMGDVHGMTVTRHATPVHGKTSPVRHDGRGVFAGLTSPFEATRYHSLVVLEESVGPGWEVSAWTDEPAPGDAEGDGRGGTRRVVMGLRRVWERPGLAPMEGVQFHPESFLTVEGPRLLANFLKMGGAGGEGLWRRERVEIRLCSGMLAPAPTSKVDPRLARGTFLGLETPPAPRTPYVRLAFANTQYDMHLAPVGEIVCEAGKRILGTIRAEARRVDEVTTGGRYVEPVIGRPRRVQGRVVAVDAAGNALIVDAGAAPIHLILTAPGQRAERFAAGTIVSCDVNEGATFAQSR